jgi:4,5:9,10-diseco-3-hydroxy-5,9,17-trioxoandrosta-1(10),2-diene-4-oate hydrolase
MQVADERHITVKGVNIRYVVRGAGSPVLLIHGFGVFLELWWFNIEPLSKRYLVYAMDLPGHGLSDKPPIDYTLFFATEFAADFMQALGIEHASLIGHSMGGLLALSVAINFPEKVDKLILVDSAGLSKDAPLLYRLCTVPVIGDIIVKPTIKASLRHGMKRSFYNPELVTEEMVEKDYELMRMPGTKQALLSIIRNNASLSGPHPDVVMTDKLHMVKSPTLLIHGAQDQVIPVEHVQNAYSLISDAKLEVLDECGHCPQIEKAAEFNEIIMQFLGSTHSTRSPESRI